MLYDGEVLSVRNLNDSERYLDGDCRSTLDNLRYCPCPELDLRQRAICNFSRLVGKFSLHVARQRPTQRTSVLTLWQRVLEKSIDCIREWSEDSALQSHFDIRAKLDGEYEPDQLPLLCRLPRANRQDGRAVESPDPLE